MKTLNYIFTALLLFAFACQQPEPGDQYGAPLTDVAVTSFNTVQEKLETQDSVYVKMESVINKTCKMKGCWMTVQAPEDNEIRVTFKDYGFFVPKEGAEDKEVVFEGWAYKKLTPVDELQHFAKDAGKSEEEIAAITEPKEEITFVANGVEIKKN